MKHNDGIGNCSFDYVDPEEFLIGEKRTVTAQEQKMPEKVRFRLAFGGGLT